MRKLSDLVRDRSPLLLEPDMTVQNAAKHMRDRRAGAALVAVNDREIRGIFTRGDAVRRVLAEGRHPASTRLEQVMTPAPRTVPPTTTVIEALRIMHDCGCRHLPVVERDGSIAGLVFRGDFRGRELDRIDEEEEIWARI
jgi:CBS domain-containing protein